MRIDELHVRDSMSLSCASALSERADGETEMGERGRWERWRTISKRKAMRCVNSTVAKEEKIHGTRELA